MFDLFCIMKTVLNGLCECGVVWTPAVMCLWCSASHSYCVCVYMCVCLSDLQSPAERHTLWELTLSDSTWDSRWWAYERKPINLQTDSCIIAWLLSSLLLANVHFQHTAELVKLLSMINVNYRSQVRPSHPHTPACLTLDLWPSDLWSLCRSSPMRVMMSSADATRCTHSSPSTKSVLQTIYLSPWKPVMTTSIIYADLT